MMSTNGKDSSLEERLAEILKSGALSATLLPTARPDLVFLDDNYDRWDTGLLQ